jgi:tetratricopeptide (TPR) repeat protein
MAIADYDETLKLKPDHVLALVNRGEMFLNNRNVARAKTDFDAAIRVADAADTIGVRIGADYLRAGLADDAIAEYSAWLAAHPKDDRNPAILAGRCYARGLANKELEQAMADCNAAVRASPNSVTFENRGLIYLRMGQYDKAIADYDDSLKRQPKAAGPLYGRGLAKIKKGKADDGHADLQAAAALDPTILARARQFNLVE